MRLQRFAAVLAAGILGLTLLPLSAGAEDEVQKETYTDGMFTFAYTDGGVELCGCDTTAFSVKVPSETNGRRIVGIADGAFYGCSVLESVELSDGIRYVGRYAFAGCESLKALTIPDTVETIGANAMSGCLTLETIHLPEKLSEIPEGMCYTCVTLTEINIPDTVTSIGDEAFYDCYMLPSPEMPEGLTKLGNYAFAFCSSFTEIDLPRGVTALGSGTYCGCEQITEFTVPQQMSDLGSLPFLGCKKLAAFDIEDGNLSYTAKDGVLYSKDETVLYVYPAGSPEKSFTIPDGVTTVHDAAFFGAENLTEIQFPASLQYIGAGGFDGCTALKSVLLPEGFQILYENAFADCTALQYVSLPSSLKGVGNYAFYNCPALKEIRVPAGCSTIGQYAFGYIESTDADGNAVPVKMEGFKQHTSGVNVWMIVGIVVGVIVLGGVIFLLVRVIRKNQMTPEEHEAHVLANEDYTGMAEDADDTPET